MALDDQLFSHLMHHEMRLEQLVAVAEVNLPYANFVIWNSNNLGHGRTPSNHQSHGGSFGNQGGKDILPNTLKSRTSCHQVLAKI